MWFWWTQRFQRQSKPSKVWTLWIFRIGILPIFLPAWVWFPSLAVFSIESKKKKRFTQSLSFILASKVTNKIVIFDSNPLSLESFKVIADLMKQNKNLTELRFLSLSLILFLSFPFPSIESHHHIDWFLFPSLKNCSATPEAGSLVALALVWNFTQGNLSLRKLMQVFLFSSGSMMWNFQALMDLGWFRKKFWCKDYKLLSNSWSTCSSLQMGKKSSDPRSWRSDMRVSGRPPSWIASSLIRVTSRAKKED